MNCYCCGEDRDQLVSFRCHDDKICRGCIGWLRANAGVIDTTPILPVLDLDTAADFYHRAGFDIRRHEGGGYAFVQYDDESVFDLDVTEPALDRSANRAGCYLVARDTDDWHTR